MTRRDFIALLGGAVAAWPLAVQGQQPERMRRIGVLAPFDINDPEGQRLLGEFKQRLVSLGWTDGQNLLIDYRFAGGRRM